MNKNYIDNKRFEEVIHLYLKDKKVHEDELIKLLILLVNNIVDSFKFKHIEPEDSKQECLLLLLKVLPNFKPEYGSAFNYCSTVIVNNLKLLYTKQKKYNIKLEAYTAYYKRIHRGKGDDEAHVGKSTRKN